VEVELRGLGPTRCSLSVYADGVGLDRAGAADSLGLELVNDLADQLHGSVALSVAGGTRFTVTFDAS